MPAYALLMLPVGSLILNRLLSVTGRQGIQPANCIKEQHTCVVTEKLLSVLVKVACKPLTSDDLQRGQII